MSLERQYRLHEAAERTGYSVAALRKKIWNKEIGSVKTNRIVTIPESELKRLIGTYRPPVELAG